MAGSSDPRAAGFNASEFRDALRFAMNMGLPEATSEQATFRWSVKRTYEIADPAGDPYDFAATPASTVKHDDVQIPVAVEFKPAGGTTSAGTPMGSIESGAAVLTVLDEDYEQVAGADLVLLGGHTYFINYVGPPMGLFDVTIYQIYTSAIDESTRTIPARETW